MQQQQTQQLHGTLLTRSWSSVHVSSVVDLHNEYSVSESTDARVPQQLSGNVPAEAHLTKLMCTPRLR